MYGQYLAGKRVPRKLNKPGFKLFLMAMPFVVFIFLFSYIPLFGWSYAFFEYKPGIPLSQVPFVGWKYFHMLLEERDDVFRVLKNTLIFGFLGILVSPIPVAIAIMINEVKSRKFRSVVQTLTTLPNFISWIIVYSLFYSLLANTGLVNRLIIKWFPGSEGINFLGNIDYVWPLQTAIGLWKTAGWDAIIYLAAITSIDESLYEAAKVDGAGTFKRIWHITVPGLMPTIIVLLLLKISNILAVGFDQYFVFYNPLVAGKMEVLDYYVYRVGIMGNDYSFGTAVGIAKSVVSIVLLFLVNSLSKRVRGESIV